MNIRREKRGREREKKREREREIAGNKAGQNWTLLQKGEMDWGTGCTSERWTEEEEEEGDRWGR